MRIQNKGWLVPRFILASGSATRQALLESVRIPFDPVPARIDEVAVRAALRREDASPRDVADTLAEMKARKVQDRQADAIVLGSDQVLALKGRLLEKPADREAAARQLCQLQGEQHTLLSAAVLVFEGRPIWRTVGQARLRMHAMEIPDIERYLDVAWPNVEGSLGAYHAEGFGARLFSRIEGDWFSVLGLPLLELCSFLRLRGWLR